MALKTKLYKMKLLAYLCRIQGFYYLIIGLWPLIDVQSFMDLTGPKTDVWLVRTVGVLVADIGIVLLMSQHNKRIELQIEVLAMLSAFGLGIIDVINSITGRIPIIYLADAFIESFFFTAFLISAIRFRRSGGSTHEKGAKS